MVTINSIDEVLDNFIKVVATLEEQDKMIEKNLELSKKYQIVFEELVKNERFNALKDMLLVAVVQTKSIDEFEFTSMLLIKTFVTIGLELNSIRKDITVH